MPPGSRLNPVSTPAVEVAESPRGPLWKKVSPSLMRSDWSVEPYWPAYVVPPVVIDVIWE